MYINVLQSLGAFAHGEFPSMVFKSVRDWAFRSMTLGTDISTNFNGVSGTGMPSLTFVVLLSMCNIVYFMQKMN